MTGIVLAGGESRRMGSDKAFLEIGGLPMIEHVLRAVRPVVNRVIIVANSAGNYASYGVETVTDVFDERGSLIGLYSGLLRSCDEYNLVIACDMPFLNTELLSYMAGLIPRYEAVVPKAGNFIEPLHAVYHKDLLPAIKNNINRGQRRIRNIFDGRRIRYVTEEEIERFDPMRRSFINLNTREEYRKIVNPD